MESNQEPNNQVSKAIQDMTVALDWMVPRATGRSIFGLVVMNPIFSVPNFIGSVFYDAAKLVVATPIALGFGAKALVLTIHNINQTQENLLTLSVSDEQAMESNIQVVVEEPADPVQQFFPQYLSNQQQQTDLEKDSPEFSGVKDKKSLPIIDNKTSKPN